MLSQHSGDAGECLRIKVFGIGGAGVNATSYMIEQGMKTIDIIAIDTDAVALKASKVPECFDIGTGLTGFCQPHSSVIRQHCEQYRTQLCSMSQDADIVLLCAGLGGGTGSGATPVVAEEAVANDALVIAFVTFPFSFEGRERMDTALEGLNALKQHADILVVIPNDRVADLLDRSTRVSGAFSMSDKMLYAGVRAVTDIFSKPTCIDFPDSRKLLKGQGYAALGIGTAEGINRAVRATENALTCPLLDRIDVSSADSILVHIQGGSDMLAGEVSCVYDAIKSHISRETKLISGVIVDDKEHPQIEITVITTGIAPAPDN